MNDEYRRITALLVMAFSSVVALGVFFYVRIVLFGIALDRETIFLTYLETAGIVLSTIALSGQWFYKRFDDDDESDSVRRFTRWRIWLVHGLTIVVIVADAMNVVFF